MRHRPVNYQNVLCTRRTGSKNGLGELRFEGDAKPMNMLEAIRF